MSKAVEKIRVDRVVKYTERVEELQELQQSIVFIFSLTATGNYCQGC
jgi:hypothetical protein